jgi:DNA-directed RNA polymerase specialized sigma24 family protein
MSFSFHTGLRFADSERPVTNEFPTTHWSRIIAAGDREGAGAHEALAELCRAYWYPLYAFVRRKGHGPEDAQDLVQGLFASLLEREDLRHLEMARTPKRTLYERLRPALLEQEASPGYRQIADDLGLTEGAVKMAAHRLRARYRELLREEIARTVSGPDEVDAEIGALLAALAP